MLEPSLAGVLSGKDPIKVEIGVNTSQIIMIGICLLVVGVLIGIIIKKA